MPAIFMEITRRYGEFPLIALLTDFGEEDWYVASMKGVIGRLAPLASVIDITHQIPSYDVRAAAFALGACYQYFPEYTVFCAVVDPGVGSDRDVLCATDGRFLFVAPDNGILTLPALNAGERWRTYAVTDTDLFLPKVSSVFHGRDIFAPLAARLAGGASPANLGQPLAAPVLLPFPEPLLSAQGTIGGEVLYVDRFGNLITNIKPGVTRAIQSDPQNWRLHIGSMEIVGLSATFASRKKGEFLFYWGSGEYLEIAVNQGNAAERLGVGAGARLEILTGGSFSADLKK